MINFFTDLTVIFSIGIKYQAADGILRASYVLTVFLRDYLHITHSNFYDVSIPDDSHSFRYPLILL